MGTFDVEWQIKVCDPLGLTTEVALIPSDVFGPGLACVVARELLLSAGCEALRWLLVGGDCCF